MRAATRLLREGRPLTLDQVAEEAMVSRATAYRYFSGIEPLLVEAALDVAMPEAGTLFAGDRSNDPAARLCRADDAVMAMVRANEPSLRSMLVHSLQHQPAQDGMPSRQNRRTPLIEAALAPARGAFADSDYQRLVKALALVIGTESMLVFKDVLRLADRDADSVRRWMIDALVAAARRSDNA